MFDGLLGHGSKTDVGAAQRELEGVLLPGETVEIAFRTVRDLLVFTDRRLIVVDKQGLTGRKVSYTSVPYRAINAFSVETSGTFDLEAELKIWVSGLPGPVEKTLAKGTDVKAVQAAIAAIL
ncbi:DUF1696 domain-containing protein [Lutibaculum baratangense AMV1]|uniref:DUF1696 domain-containing protein n=1 Tax=Lutibaculum baratangense AMV1 TaxID=631454 RepID=V4QU71_9HYPH|nr:DUF1696 domain-containing protein [Lutibaculum baratangense AMV1]